MIEHIPGFVMTDFFASDCTHCQDFAPTWALAGKDSLLQTSWEQKECFGPGWSVGVDHDLCKNLDVGRFPTVKMIHYDSAKTIDKVWDFTGERTAQALRDFAQSKIDEFNSRHDTPIVRNCGTDSLLFLECLKRARTEFL